MPKLATPLIEIQVRNAKPKEKPYKLADGGGMYLEVMPHGSRTWRMSFVQANGKKNRLTFGQYPEVSLAEAREKRAAARKMLNNGIDPAEVRNNDKLALSDNAAQTFEKLAREWHSNKLSTWHETTAKDTLRRLENDIFPEIGHLPIASITHQQMIAALRKIELRGTLELAHRIKANCARIFSYAIQQGLAVRNCQ